MGGPGARAPWQGDVGVRVLRASPHHCPAKASPKTGAAGPAGDSVCAVGLFATSARHRVHPAHLPGMLTQLRAMERLASPEHSAGHPQITPGAQHVTSLCSLPLSPRGQRLRLAVSPSSGQDSQCFSEQAGLMGSQPPRCLLVPAGSGGPCGDQIGVASCPQTQRYSVSTAHKTHKRKRRLTLREPFSKPGL